MAITAKEQLEAYLNESICDDGDPEAKAEFALAAMNLFGDFIFQDAIVDDTSMTTITIPTEEFKNTLKTFVKAEGLMPEIRALREKSNIPDAAK